MHRSRHFVPSPSAIPLVSGPRARPWPIVAAALATCLLAVPATSAQSVDTPAAQPANQGKPKLVEVDLGKFGEEAPPPELPFGRASRNFRGELERLHALANDATVQAVELKPAAGLGDARTLDILKELRALKAAGKKIVCHCDVLDRAALVFASAADLLAMPPAGMVELAAPSAEVLYLKGLLDKVGVRYQVLHIGEFKTAFEEMRLEHMSDPQRLELREILAERYDQAVAAIAANRRIAREKVEAGFESVLLSAAEAQALGLIDAVAWRDEFDADVAKLLGGEPERERKEGSELDELEKSLDNPFGMLTLFKKMLAPDAATLPSGARIAIVYCAGEIVDGKSGAGLGGATAGDATLVAALDEVRRDDDVKAVVLRIDSPGGSALASDLIWRAVQRVREKKPVVASMGDVAASGGYWIAMGCDKIVAQPSTITGSIGVVAAVPDLSAVLKNVGVNVEVVGAGPHGEELSTLRDGLPPFLAQKIVASMQRTYDQFIAKAAAGRKLDPVELEKLARGRVYTGRKAKELHLVDGLGGLRDAIVLACYLADRLDPATTPVLELPKAASPFERLQELLDGMVTVRGNVGRVARAAGLEAALPWLDALLRDGAAPAGARLLCLLPQCWRMR